MKKKDEHADLVCADDDIINSCIQLYASSILGNVFVMLSQYQEHCLMYPEQTGHRLRNKSIAKAQDSNRMQTEAW